MKHLLVALLMSLIWLPALGQVEPPTYVRPEICKTVDNLPQGHSGTTDETLIRAGCRRGPATSCPQPVALASDVSTIAMCAVSPDDPDHGPKRRAIRSDPMAVAVTMAQGKQR
jgi:hypothetical protein